MSIRRVVITLLVLGVVGSILFVELWIKPERKYFEDFAKHSVVYHARLLSEALEDFKDENGSYPRSHSEVMRLTTNGLSLVDDIAGLARATSRRRRPELNDIIIPQMEQDWTVLVLSGEHARIEFYDTGRIGISRSLTTEQPGSNHEDRIVILSDECWHSPSEKSQ